jgi:hypothetical protein
LDEIKRYAEQHHRRDDGEVGYFPGRGGNRTGYQNEDAQRILEAGEELKPRGPFPVIAEKVGAKLGESR